MKKIILCTVSLLKCFSYQLICNRQAYQSLGAKKMKIVPKIALTKAFLAIRQKHIFSFTVSRGRHNNVFNKNLSEKH